MRKQMCLVLFPIILNQIPTDSMRSLDNRRKGLAPAWAKVACSSLFSLFPLMMTGCAVHKVVPASETLVVDGGASYYLPKLMIVAAVPIERADSERGDFAFYSRPLLGIPADLSDAKEVSFKIGSEISFDYTGVQDPEQHFIALYPKGIFKTFGQTLTLNPEGVMTSGNATVEDKTVDFVVSTIEGASKIAAASLNPAGAKTRFIPSDRPGMADLVNYLNKMDKTSAPALQVGTLAFGLTLLLEQNPDDSLALMKESIADIEGLRLKIQTAREEEKPGLRVDLAKAEEVQKEILAHEDLWVKFADDRPKAYRDVRMAAEAFKELRELDKIGGSARASADHRQYKDEYAKILARFIDRKVEKATSVVQLSWAPNPRGSEVVNGQVKGTSNILVLDSNRGVVAGARPLSTFPSNLKAAGAKGKITAVSLECNAQVPPDTLAWQQRLAERGSHGWHYRIPAKGTVTLRVGGSVKLRRDAYVAQYGCVAFVPATAANQKIVSNIDLDPITGGIKSVTHGGQAFDPAIMSRTGAAVADVINAQDARKAATAGAIDQEALLERRKNILQLKKDIAELEQQVSP